ncbi:hypothetical protein WN944_028014 [Citrus x changshan-huyou]|uniref:Uncharacterized protein n=1 Tax=Citrus x changshan-huyou TaxID=2935761 RepID=A0AAP0LIL0_9ROSI
MEIMFFFVRDDYIYIAYFFCYASSILCLNANLRFWLLDPSFAMIVLPDILCGSWSCCRFCFLYPTVKSPLSSSVCNSGFMKFDEFIHTDLQD